MENLSNEELNAIFQSIPFSEIVKHLPLEQIAQQVYQLIEPKLAKLIQDEVDIKIQETELVKNYNHNPDLIRYHGQPVDISTDQSSSHIVIKKLNGNRSHIYWIVPSANSDYVWLVPKIGLSINRFQYSSFQKIFTCAGYNPDGNNKLKLVQPAMAQLLPTGTDWKLIETGQIVFGAIANSPDVSTRNKNVNEHQIQVIDIKNAEQDIFKVIAISPDAKTIASSGDEQKISIWDLTTEQKQASKLIEVNSTVRSLVITDDHKIITSGSGKNIDLWHLNTGIKLYEFEGHSASIRTVAVHNQKQILVSCSQDNTIRIWNLQTYQPKRILRGHTNTVSAVAISKDGKKLVSGDDSGEIKIWHWEQNEPLYITKYPDNNQVQSMVISPSQNFFVSASRHGAIKVFNLSDGELFRTIPVASERIYSIAISFDEKIFIGCNDGKIWIIDLKSGKEINCIEAHSGTVYQLIISPDGKTLVSGSSDQTMKVWSLLWLR